MKAVSIVYRALTTTEFKAINGLIQSQGGGSQTYIDFPKGSISDNEWKEFLGEPITSVSNGFKWNVKVNGLSLGMTQELIEISSRRESTNSLRDQYNNRLKIWSSLGEFPDANHQYEESNPIIVFLIKDMEQQYWAGWFYKNECSVEWFMNIELASIFYNKAKGASGYIQFTYPISFDDKNRKWPFTNVEIANSKRKPAESSRQIIYYGAPGTGKSNKTDEATNETNRVRTTFHPDSDYSTFVGAYKPTMKKLPRYNPNDGTQMGEEEKITYEFVPQAFLQAYVTAWTRKSEGNEEPFYLVIEEINRGNCAQIFGDLFQLLDRNDEGESRYGICPDKDITRYLRKTFEGLNIQDERIKSGKEMRLPSNLYVWATMNTSDQSLFPIDSAFKRRWDWEYVPIADAGKGHVIKIGAKHYDWWTFISTINEKIDSITGSEDKKLGYWFVKPADGSTVITAKQFVSKVLFYLWNDVYKDYADSDQSIFRTKDGKAPFTSFFWTDSEQRLQAFMEYNGIDALTDEEVAVKEESTEAQAEIGE